MFNCIQALMQRRGFLASAIFASSLLAGCATNLPGVSGAASTAASTKAEDIVRIRAQERVDLLLNRKFDNAYAYLTPSYRALHNVETYRNSFGNSANWVSPQVDKVECQNNERCTVTVKLGVMVAMVGFGGKPVPSTMVETWLQEDGQWWYYQRD